MIPEGRCQITGEFELAVGSIECWSCHATFTVATLVARPGSLIRNCCWPPDELTTTENVLVGDATTIGSCITPPETITANFRRVGRYGYSNYCPSCKARTGDFYLTMELDGPFFRYPTGDITHHQLGTGTIECAEP